MSKFVILDELFGLLTLLSDAFNSWV